ncbi:hypothetical protein RR48_06016 [Papilio machaon]|uniref:Uncharacterized protein n=1 Tax=Papilio machaon TaxID=76193 RepID=A0A194RJE7_PAPMA|nr:hypothetical protein RR48_06016 [Papilio machaon]
MCRSGAPAPARRSAALGSAPRGDALQVRGGQSARAGRRSTPLYAAAPARYKTDYPLRIKSNPVSCVPRHGLERPRLSRLNRKYSKVRA